MRLMKTWFEFLDADGSGEVGLEELEDPLVSVGLARSREDVEDLVKLVDKSGNGEINLKEGELAVGGIRRLDTTRETNFEFSGDPSNPGTLRAIPNFKTHSVTASRSSL